MTMKNIQHIAIVVSDIKKVLSCYQSEFDAKLKYADQSWALLQWKTFRSSLFCLISIHPISRSRAKMRKLMGRSSAIEVDRLRPTLKILGATP
jgi:hypothetical protein